MSYGRNCYFCRKPLDETNALIWITLPCCEDCFREKAEIKTVVKQ